MNADVVVVGAGAAGLAAAHVLSRAGIETAVLEARDRIGGRLLTREDPELPLPIELGGEFVHGAVEATFALLRAANTVPIDTAGTAFSYEDGALREGEDRFGILARVMNGARDLDEDVSVEAFLIRLGDDPRTQREREYARMLVEGFDAADPRRASARAIADEWCAGQGGQLSSQFRFLGGYARLMRTLHGMLDPARVAVRLSTPVHAIRRDRRGVHVEAVSPTGAALEVHARAALVTIPVGVLNAGTVRFDPPLPALTRDALEYLIMGPVVKLVMFFRTAFWETLRGGRYRNGAIFHRRNAAFPTFWTMLPLRAPVLVAWAGGPKADALAGLEQPALVERALDELQTLFGRDADPRDALTSAYAHDWLRDPYSRGAYSYVAVGGVNARAHFAAPVDGTLFFAGEAAVAAREAGTVAGALQSGERAANEILRTLRTSVAVSG